MALIKLTSSQAGQKRGERIDHGGADPEYSCCSTASGESLTVAADLAVRKGGDDRNTDTLDGQVRCPHTDIIPVARSTKVGSSSSAMAASNSSLSR